MAKIPTIIDNRSGNTVLNALNQLLLNLKKLDIATGFFEVGSFLQIEPNWQTPDQIRLLMGNETSKTTQKVIIESALAHSNNSIELQKERDDTLTGLDALKEAITGKKVQLKAFTKAKFHAKSYLMESRDPSPVDFAIVGSSNFTRPGLTENVELNLFSTDQNHIESLREWFEELWKQADDISPELLKVIEPHLKQYDPFTVYCRALYEYFAGKEKTQDAWELQESAIYSMLSSYQRDGYHQALQIAEEWDGALICDGVGLGKTFIGLMILERCIHEGKQVLMIVPKSAEESVWRANIERYLTPRYPRQVRHYLDIRRHTDFGRPNGITDADLDFYRKEIDVIIMDEAHHFRNPRANRGELFMDIAKGKKLYMLTATPINNSIDDLYHLVNYFAQNNHEHFLRAGINHFRKHFLEINKRLESEKPAIEATEAVEEEDLIRTDTLLNKVVIQRSRKYVQESETGNGDDAPLFPERQLPKVVSYSLKTVYENIYSDLKEAFDKDNPFLNLAIYNKSHYKKHKDQEEQHYQQLLVGLIRTLLLKRLESSFKAFEASVEDLLAKMADFLRHHNPDKYAAWTQTKTRWWKLAQAHIAERLEKDEPDTENEEDEGLLDIKEEILSDKEYDLNKLCGDILEDMEHLTSTLSKIYRRFYQKDKEGRVEDPQKDTKLQTLIDTLQNEPLLHNQKVLIFSEFRNTSRYLADQLRKAGFENVEQVDSGRNVKNRELVIKRFSPLYNQASETKDLLGQSELSYCLDNPIDILISTDVLSEGLNLQDACLIINYDLHWNPVRLMQRIGRVDRRLNPDIEAQLDRPPHLKQKVYFWNFLPPDELEELLHLKQKLDGKIMRINKTLGIEGALISPDDPDMAMKLFNERYEGKESVEELMRLERNRFAEQYPELWQSLAELPRRLFSGKAAGEGFGPVYNKRGQEIERIAPFDRPGVFACYRMPPVIGKAADNLLEVSNETYDLAKHGLGQVRWYFLDAETGQITENLEQAWAAVRCTPETGRTVNTGPGKLKEVQKIIEKHIKNTYLKKTQAPIGAKPTLLAWMEIN